jgi:protein O-GlcNAc transferase
MDIQLQLMLKQAIEAFQAQKFDNAALVLKKILQVDSKNLPALHILGLVKVSQSNYKEAADYLARAARITPNDASIQYNLAKALTDSGNDEKALTHHEKVISLTPNNPEAWLSYGKTMSNLGRYDDALVCYGSALNLKPDYADALLNNGATLKELKRYNEAITFAEQALAINPNLTQAWSNKGGALKELKQYDKAIACYDKALSLRPDYHEAWTKKGVSLHELKRYDEAIACYDKALSLRPDYHEAWTNKGVSLHELKRYDEAIACYDKVLSLQPDYYGAWANKGVSLHELKRHDEAIACYDKALNLQPNYHEAWSNKGGALKELKRYDEAIACLDRALSLQPDYHEAWTNKGVSLHELKRYDEAIACYDKALNLSPNIDWIYGDLVDVKLKICNWLDLTTQSEIISKKVMANEKVLQPFSLLTLIDDGLLHKKSSEIATKFKYPFNSILGEIPKYPKGEKIRIGYFSADFKNHPVAFLMAELFELHDRSNFEIYAFSLVNACDAMRERLQKAFDHFIGVDGMSDVAVAKLAREHSIDIAVDLSGFTKDARTGIFSHRAAPIQVNYLGYPGTMGANYFDYIIADKTLIPLDSQSHYSEKVVYLPNSYQVNDRNRLISDRQFTRQELGLPEEGFVFCCFNNNFKILSSTFEVWMRILKAVEGSVLWLLQDNPQAVENLKKEAHKKGIDIRRLVFADRVPLSEHLARHRFADLFIDTLPYNAHTTASDALWTGLPVLTLQGNSFAGRVASSLLNAIELPELITYNQEEYEAMAIELAKNHEKLASIKKKLESNRLTAPLFDTPFFTRNMEAAYNEMMERYWLDSKPDHITII